MSTEQFHTSTHAEASATKEVKPPPLVALFLIKFDLKIGYTIAWKRSINNVPLEGIVEYKSLPSGLHNVDEDLIYFFHEQYAGISAFAKCKASEQERNANFVAVGAMLPLKDGRLGRAWLHAEHLRKLSKELVLSSVNTNSLVDYWEEFGAAADDNFSSPQLSPFTLAQRKTRAMSSATLSMDEKHSLPNYHPALAILNYIDVFGPLIFPIHRAALLRKRILFVNSPPIRQSCEFVYDLSVFSSTPVSLASSLALPSESLVRLRPLFSVGIHDIPLLEELSVPTPLSNLPTPTTSTEIPFDEDDEDPDPPDRFQNTGWIACTTDEIIAMKPKLYDIVIEMPSSHVGHEDGNKRPIMKASGDKKEIKATQRDWRRYRLLRRALKPLRRLTKPVEEPKGDHEDVGDETPLLRSMTTLNDDDDSDDETDAVEGSSWSELAYSSFLWWASAGEQDERLLEEERIDIDMLGDLDELVHRIADLKRYKDDEDVESPSTIPVDDPTKQDARVEMEIISYFHRLSKSIFDTCSEVLTNAAPENDMDMDDTPRVDWIALRSMGLDGWSNSDREFVHGFFELWYEREVKVDPLGVECCGVRIC